jgi:hypothetical protein
LYRKLIGEKEERECVKRVKEEKRRKGGDEAEGE